MTTKKHHILFVLSVFILSGHLYSQKIESFSISSCDKSIRDIDFINERISQYELVSDTLKIVLDLVENCALKPSPTLGMQKDTLHIDLNHSSNVVDMCDCCYELRFVISGVKQFDSSIVRVVNKTLSLEENKLILLPDDYKINDTTTFNQMSSSHLKSGVWKVKHHEKNVETLSFYKIIDGESTLMWRKIYNIDSKELRSIMILVRNNVLLELSPRQYEEILNNRP